MTTDAINTDRRRFLTAATTAVGAAGVVGAAIPFVGSWNPSAKAKAAGAPVKADVSKLEPGQMVTVEWRGMPVYIVNRTEAQLEELPKLDSQLKDPDSKVSEQPPYIEGPDRSIKPNMLVIVGLCTHLGCAPKFVPEIGAISVSGGEWQGGFFCPCHGSTFDMSGRVFSGVPANANLVVPPYTYETDTVIIIGEDMEAA
ncbi:MAG: ubiquinol-cytochrome c reductase iron-sulfur subunit [Pseudomonadota bacterium]